MDLSASLLACASRIESVLDRVLPPADATPERLHEAMRYSALGGGKRLRPMLAYAACRLFSDDDSRADSSAAAVELIHAYSLIHDDLPAMDDDALRRGQPTVHVAFDEATAILAGDALQSLAFEMLAGTKTDDTTRVALLRTLALASGAAGMCGGQALDLAATGNGSALSLAELERLHALKTGALIRSAVRMGALCGHAGDEDLQDRKSTRLDSS